MVCTGGIGRQLLELFYCFLMTFDDTHRILLVNGRKFVCEALHRKIFRRAREKESAKKESLFKGTGAPQEPFRIDSALMQAAGHPQRLQTPTVPWYSAGISTETLHATCDSCLLPNRRCLILMHTIHYMFDFN